MNSGIVSASTRYYPIPELDNCRNAKECYYYCQIPQNSPACWSYNKYILNDNILGDETVNITYPIVELGNCASAEACFLYCAQPQNQAVCLTYAKSNGLVKETDTGSDDAAKPEVIDAAKTELGCTSKDTCMAVCNDPDNFEKCRNFATKYKLEKSGKDDQPPPEVVAQAKKELGCANEISCRNFCNKPENNEKCFAFAKKYKLIKQEELDKRDEFEQKKEQMLLAAKTQLGCDSPEACKNFCEIKDNAAKCKTLAQQFGLGPQIQANQANSPTQNSFSNSPGQNAVNNTAEVNKPPLKPAESSPSAGNAFGPGGCKTEKECKAYCEKNPSGCPGFPKTSAKLQPTPRLSPPPNKNALSKNTRISPTPKRSTLNPASIEPEIQNVDAEAIPLVTLPPLTP